MNEMIEIGEFKNIEIKICELFGKLQYIEDKLWLSGNVFYENCLLSTNELYDLLSSANDESKIETVIRELNGFFSIVLFYNNEYYIIADKLRSIPLFYTNISGIFLVSDSIQYLTSRITRIEKEALSVEEFLKTGYVTGRDTLIKNFYQVQSCEVVKISNNQCLSSIYYLFLPQNRAIVDSDDMSEWIQKVDVAMKHSIDRLVKIADGRQIVIPLSGGYDSRAIAIYLKESGYKNLFAFTFGRKTSPEVKISKQVAEALGIEWVCVEYTKETWKDIKDKQWFKEYVKLINSAVSVPNVQVVPAIKELYENGTIQKNALLVPGHAADYVAGSHIPKNCSRSENSLFSVIDSINELERRHYCYNRKVPISKELRSKIERQAERYWNFFAVNTSKKQHFIGVAETWNYRERQAKFIANSNRYYDYFKLKWHMPFWDNEFMQVWEDMPFEYRSNELLWIELVNAKFSPYSAVELGHSSKNDNRIVASFKSVFNYFYDPNHLLRLVPFHVWFLYKFKLSKKDGSLFGYLANYAIDLLFENKRVER